MLHLDNKGMIYVFGYSVLVAACWGISILLRKSLREGVKLFFGMFTYGEIRKQPLVMNLRRLILGPFLLLLALWCWPILLWHDISEEEADKKSERVRKQRATDIALREVGLFLPLMSAGNGACENCGWEGVITGCLHGASGPDSFWTAEGAQCQDCGTFSSIREGSGVDPAANQFLCQCGGDITRYNILFCPLCRSTAIEYQMSMVT